MGEGVPAGANAPSSVERAGGVVRRAVEAADAEFLLALYASTRQSELALTGWEPATLDAFVRMQFQLQQRHYREHYPGAEHSIFLALEAPVGAWMVWRGAREIVLVDMALLPAYRGSGIGTRCLIELTGEAARGARRVRLCVRPDSRARGLYRRLGFRELSGDVANVSMEWSQRSPAAR